MPSRGRQILAALAFLALAPTARAEAPLERGLITARQFLERCDLRQDNEAARIWCYAYVFAAIDTMLAVQQAFNTGDQICLRGRTPPQAAEAVLAEIDRARSSRTDAGVIVLVGIGRALNCKGD